MCLCLDGQGVVVHAEGGCIVAGQMAEVFVEASHRPLEFVGRTEVLQLVHRLFGGVLDQRQCEALMEVQPMKTIIIHGFKQRRVDDDETFEDMPQDTVVLHGTKDGARLRSQKHLPDFHPSPLDCHHAEAVCCGEQWH